MAASNMTKSLDGLKSLRTHIQVRKINNKNKVGEFELGTESP
jgi:hypothetical protein